jgi:hypothetical protein
MKFEILGIEDLRMRPAALSGNLYFPFLGKTGVKALYHG